MKQATHTPWKLRHFAVLLAGAFGLVACGAGSSADSSTGSGSTADTTSSEDSLTPWVPEDSGPELMFDGSMVDGSFIEGSLVEGSFIEGSFSDGSFSDGSASDGSAFDDIGAYDPEFAYRRFFINPEDLTEADAHYAIEYEMRGYRAARACMEAAGERFVMPTPRQLRAWVDVAQTVDYLRAEKSQGDYQFPDYDVEPPVLTDECMAVQTAGMDRLYSAIEPFQEAWWDAFDSAYTEPEMIQAEKDWSSCMASSGFKTPNHDEFYNWLFGSDRSYDDPEFVAATAADERCSEKFQRTVDAVVQRHIDEFAKTYHSQIVAALEEMQP